MNALSVLHSDASWWPAHMALPRIVRERIKTPTAGVEVGVAFGSMSIWLARLLPQLQMLCVDPFVGYDPGDGMSEIMASSGDDIEQLVRWRFANEGHGRLNLVRQTSEQAAAGVADQSQDFVFIDADHRYEAVVQDIQLWRPKVRSGGLLCGHDFCAGWPSVVAAVRDTFGKNGLYDPVSSVWFVRMP
jgi:cephalosporin hydroxylase